MKKSLQALIIFFLLSPTITLHCKAQGKEVVPVMLKWLQEYESTLVWLLELW